MDLEPDTVAGRVDEAARRRIAWILLLTRTQRVVAGCPDGVLDELVNLAPGHTGTQRLDARVLSALHNVVDLPDLRGRLALGYGPRHVGPVPRLFVLRKDVHDDRLLRVQGAGADLMRIGPLRAGRADRAVGRISALEKG